MTEPANATMLIGMDGKPIYPDESPFAAAYTLHWPNGPVPACEVHTRKLQALASVMGMHVAIANAPRGSQCTNCINESQKMAAP
jgi:hypothetical protein